VGWAMALVTGPSGIIQWLYCPQCDVGLSRPHRASRTKSGPCHLGDGPVRRSALSRQRGLRPVVAQ
jgi:hypothetical protein